MHRQLIVDQSLESPGHQSNPQTFNTRGFKHPKIKLTASEFAPHFCLLPKQKKAKESSSSPINFEMLCINMLILGRVKTLRHLSDSCVPFRWGHGQAAQRVRIAGIMRVGKTCVEVTLHHIDMKVT